MIIMPCGERAVRCLLGEPVDRIPFGVGIGWLPWGETATRWRHESGNPTLDVAAELGYELSFACPALKAGIYPAFAHQVLAETAEYVTWRDGQGITKRDRRDGGSMPEFLAYPVTTPDDWEILKRERLRLEEPGRVPADWEKLRARLRETGEAVQVGCFPYGVFGTARDLLGVEDLLVGLYTEPEMIRDMMEHLTSLWLHLWAQVAEHVQIDHIHLWEDMSGRQGSLISPAMVESFMMPCYDRIADFARAHGVRLISVDTDGNCAELVPVMMRHGVNVFFPFEVQAGNDMLAYRRQYPTLGIMGGLDKRALAGTTAEIDREVDRAREMVAQGRYIPMFDHLIPPDVPWDNFVYAVRQLRAVTHAPRALGKRPSTCGQ